MDKDEDFLNLEELDRIEESAENKLKVKNRFQTLSEKVKLEAQAKEQAEAKLLAEAEARVTAEKERDFFKDFSSKASQYQGASDHQDKIWEKVKAGYETEDAIIAVLGKEGKLGNQPPQEQRQNQVIAGGSASTILNDGGNKDLKDMTPDDKLNALFEIERQGGISLS